MLRIDFGILFPFFRQIIEREDRRNWTNRHTRSTVDTLDWVDVQLSLGRKIVLIFPGMNAVNRACIHACRVLCSNTGFSNYVSHENRTFLIPSRVSFNQPVHCSPLKPDLVYYFLTQRPFFK